MVNSDIDYDELKKKYEGKHDLDRIFTCLKNLVKPTNVEKS